MHRGPAACLKSQNRATAGSRLSDVPGSSLAATLDDLPLDGPSPSARDATPAREALPGRAETNAADDRGGPRGGAPSPHIPPSLLSEETPRRVPGPGALCKSRSRFHLVTAES